MSRRKWLYVIIALIIIVSTLVVTLFLFVFKPNVEVTSSVLRTGGGFLSPYWVAVDVSVFNHGWSGDVTVWVEITYETTGETWKKAQTVYINSKESKDVTITFTLDSAIYFGDFTRNVWVT